MCDLKFVGTRIRVLHETAQRLAYLHCSGPDPDCKPLIHLDVKRLQREMLYVKFNIITEQSLTDYTLN